MSSRRDTSRRFRFARALDDDDGDVINKNNKNNNTNDGGDRCEDDSSSAAAAPPPASNATRRNVARMRRGAQRNEYLDELGRRYVMTTVAESTDSSPSCLPEARASNVNISECSLLAFASLPNELELRDVAGFEEGQTVKLYGIPGQAHVVNVSPAEIEMQFRSAGADAVRIARLVQWPSSTQNPPFFVNATIRYVSRVSPELARELRAQGLCNVRGSSVVNMVGFDVEHQYPITTPQLVGLFYSPVELSRYEIF